MIRIKVTRDNVTTETVFTSRYADKEAEKYLTDLRNDWLNQPHFYKGAEMLRVKTNYGNRPFHNRAIDALRPPLPSYQQLESEQMTHRSTHNLQAPEPLKIEIMHN
jgi:hypothetical protein